MSGQLTTEFIAKTMGAKGHEVRPGTNRAVTGGTADSRTVRSGDLFAAFRGEHLDGNEFVEPAAAAGAAAIVCERAPAELPADVTVVVARDTRVAIKELATEWRSACTAQVIGITGTVGKTTAKEAVASLLASQFRVHRSPGNMNSREGLPLALLTLRRDHEISVLEMAMDSPGEILELCAVAKPNLGAVLNIGLTHVSKLGSLEAIAEEKLSLPRYLGPEATAILNVDDPLVAGAANSLACQVIRYGKAGSNADLVWGNVEDRGLEGVSFDVRLRERPTVRARSPLPGVHILPAAVTAIATGIALGLELPETVAALEAATIEGRMRSLKGIRGSTLLDDSYNSSPASLAGALATLNSLGDRGKGRRLALIGPMAELGTFEEREHRKAGRLAAVSCDALFATGEPCKALVIEAQRAGLTDAHWFPSKDEAATRLAAAIQSGDTVLVKASRSLALESVIPLLSDEESE